MSERERSPIIARKVIRPDLSYSILSPHTTGIEPLYVNAEEIMRRRILGRDNTNDSYRLDSKKD